MKILTQDVIFESDHLSHDLARKSIWGGMTTMTAQGVHTGLQIAGMVVLARLLTPDDYGLIGMVTVVTGFAAMFKDAGLSMATIQKDRITRDQITTLFWINVFISGVLGLCVMAGSPLVAWFYGRPELTAVTAVLSLSFIISGLTLQHQALLRRHMYFGTLATIQIAAQVLTLGVTIVLALLGWRYWALIVGSVVTTLASVLLTFVFCPWVPGRWKKGTGVRGMLMFGGHMTGFEFVSYLARNMDNILIGKFIGADALGLYGRAYRLFMMPIIEIRRPLTNVAEPVLSTLKNQTSRYVKYYQHILNLLATLMIPLTLYCMLEAEFLIRLLLGSQWMGAVPVFQILAITGLIQPLAGTQGLVLLSIGFSKRYFYWGMINAILWCTSFVAGLPYGIEGVATAYAIVNYAVFIPSLFFCFRGTPIKVSLFLKTLVPPMLVAALTATGFLAVHQAWPGDSFVAHVFYTGVFVLLYVGLSLCRRSVRELLKLLFKNVPGMVAINTKTA